MIAYSCTMNVVFCALPWALVSAAVVLGYLAIKKLSQDTQQLTEQNETIIEMMKEMKKTNENEEELNPDFQLSIATDSEPKDFNLDEACYLSSTLSLDGSTTSGYNSNDDRQIDWDFEFYKISVAPKGPVPEDQVLLTVTCPFNKQYVKAVTDEEGTFVEIATFARVAGSNEWQWRRADCRECLEKIEESLKETGCEIPFAGEGDVEWRPLEEEESVQEEEKEEEVEMMAETMQLEDSRDEMMEALSYLPGKFDDHSFTAIYNTSPPDSPSKRLIDDCHLTFYQLSF